MPRTTRTPAPWGHVTGPRGLHEETVSLAEHTFQARRNAPDSDASRWQIFMDDTHAGYLRVHECADANGQPMLTVHDTNDRPIGLPDRGDRGHCRTGGPCVDSYVTALGVVWWDIERLGHDRAMSVLETGASLAQVRQAVRDAGATLYTRDPRRVEPSLTVVEGCAVELDAVGASLRRKGSYATVRPLR